MPDEEEEDDTFTDDGEFDLVATSDFDYEMDGDDFEDEEVASSHLDTSECEQVSISANDGTYDRGISRHAHFRGGVSNDECSEGMDDTSEALGDIDEPDGISGVSYGSDPPSSEEASFNTEDNPESKRQFFPFGL